LLKAKGGKKRTCYLYGDVRHFSYNVQSFTVLGLFVGTFKTYL